MRLRNDSGTDGRGNFGFSSLNMQEGHLLLKTPMQGPYDDCSGHVSIGPRSPDLPKPRTITAQKH